MTLWVQERNTCPLSIFSVSPSTQFSCRVLNQWWEFKFIHKRTWGEIEDRRGRRGEVCAWKWKENLGIASSAGTVLHLDHSGGNFTISLWYHIWEAVGANLRYGQRQRSQIRQLRYVEGNPLPFFYLCWPAAESVNMEFDWGSCAFNSLCILFFLQEILKSKV